MDPDVAMIIFGVHSDGGIVRRLGEVIDHPLIAEGSGRRIIEETMLVRKAGEVIIETMGVDF